MKELYVTRPARHRVVFAFCAYACLVLVLALPVQAQVKGRPADTGTKAAEPSAAARQDAITVNAKGAVLMEGASGQILTCTEQR